MRRLRGSRLRGSRGAALIEFVVVAPILVAFALGVIEFGFAWGSANKVERAVQNAGRVAAGQGNGRYADYEALRAIESSMSGVNESTIEKVIVFSATTADGRVPSACLSIAATGTGAKGVSGVCNVYSKDQVLTRSLAGFASPTAAGTSCASGSWDSNWCPTGRSRSLVTPVYVGIYLVVRYEGQTSLIPVSRSITRTAVFQVEPCKAGETNC